MPDFKPTKQTEAIVIYMEPGGRMEVSWSSGVERERSRPPIVAFMAGRFMDEEEMQGMIFGHVWNDRRGQAGHRHQENRAPGGAGIPVVERIDEIPGRGQGEAPEQGGAERREPRNLHRRPGRRPDAADAELSAKLEEVCPVDIFAADDAGPVEVVEENLDERVLCGLCLEAAPRARSSSRKLYDGSELGPERLAAQLLPAGSGTIRM